MITYRQIITAGENYEVEKDLRNTVLRVPLGLTLSEADVRGEEKQIHLAAMDEQDKARLSLSFISIKITAPLALCNPCLFYAR